MASFGLGAAPPLERLEATWSRGRITRYAGLVADQRLQQHEDGRLEVLLAPP